MKAPTLALQHLLPQAVAVASGRGGVIAGTVGFDSEYHPSGLVRMRACEIYAIAGDPILGSNRYSASLKPILDGEFKWIEWYILYVSTEALSTGSSIFEIAPKQVDTLGGGAAPGPCRDG